MLLNQHLDMPRLSGGWIILAKEKCSATQNVLLCAQNSPGALLQPGVRTEVLHLYDTGMYSIVQVYLVATECILKFKCMLWNTLE